MLDECREAALRHGFQAGDDILDLFCGLGNFSLPLARRAAQVTGVDADPGLILRAQANARRNGLENVSFQVGDLYQEPVSGQWLQGLVARLNDEQRVYVVTVVPVAPEQRAIHSRWPRIVTREQSGV